MLYFWSRLLLCALLIPLREHNGNIVIKKGNITFSLKQDVGRATSSACPGALFLWKLQCICFLLKKVQVYLPFKINMCLRTALNQHIFLRWIASFVVRKKEGYRVGCTWKNLGTLKEHYAPRFNSMHIESTKDQIWFRANATQIYKWSSVESSSLLSRVKASP